MSGRDHGDREQLESAQRALGGDRYQLESLLGQGAMGEVYAASDRQLKRPVVIKLLRASLTGKMQERFRLEAQVLGKLSHDNIVDVIDSGSTADGARPYLVMTRLAGKPLDEVLKQSAEQILPVARACDVARQLLAGLGYVHDRNIVHRDIKPANLFVCDDGTVKLLDFGVIKLVEALTGVMSIAPTEEGLAVGTPRYLSPEQAVGKPVDRRTDLYAIGCVVYRMLVGRGPFDHCKSIASMLFAHVREEPRPPSQLAPQPIDPRLDAIVVKALAKAPADRYQTAAELAAALAQFGRDVASSPAVAAGGPEPTQALPEMAPPAMGPPKTEALAEMAPPAMGPPKTQALAEMAPPAMGPPKTQALAEMAPVGGTPSPTMALDVSQPLEPTVRLPEPARPALAATADDRVALSGSLGGSSLEAQTLGARPSAPSKLPLPVLFGTMAASALLTIVIDLLARGF